MHSRNTLPLPTGNIRTPTGERLWGSWLNWFLPVWNLPGLILGWTGWEQYWDEWILTQRTPNIFAKCTIQSYFLAKLRCLNCYCFAPGATLFYPFLLCETIVSAALVRFYDRPSELSCMQPLLVFSMSWKLCRSIKTGNDSKTVSVYPTLQLLHRLGRHDGIAINLEERSSNDSATLHEHFITQVSNSINLVHLRNRRWFCGVN